MNRKTELWIIVLALLAVYVCAQQFDGEADFAWEPFGNGVIITGFTGGGTAVQIPPQIQGMPVLSIGTAAFLQRGLAVIIIPDTVTSIGPMAFASNHLTSVNIPPGVTSIGQLAFADNQLSSVIIPTGVTSIGYRAFHGNQLLIVIIPDSVVSIGDDAFGDARLLRPDGTEALIADFQPDAASLQAGPPARRRNWFSTELSFVGLGFRYERHINDRFSVGGRIFVNYFWWDIFNQLDDGLSTIENMYPGHTMDSHSEDGGSGGILVTARFFPWRFPFYLELGMGLGSIALSQRFDLYYAGSRSGDAYVRKSVTGFMIAPAMGVRIGGQRRGFFVNPFVNLPIVIADGTAMTSLVMGIGLGSSW